MDFTVEHFLVMLIKKYGDLSLSVSDLENFTPEDTVHIQYNPEGIIFVYKNRLVLEAELDAGTD